VETFGQIELLFEDRNQHVNADGDPDLSLDGIGRSAEEALDAQVLLDPLEEQFDLPPTLVQFRNGQSWQGEVVGQVDKESSGVVVEEPDSSQTFRISLKAVECRELNDLIGSHALIGRHRQGMNTNVSQRPFGSDHEESALLMHHEKPGEIQIGTVHHIERTGLYHEFVQGIDIVEFPVAYMNKSGDWATQVQQGVKFDGGFCAAKTRPREHAQAQVDGGRIQSVNGRIQIGRQWLSRIHLARSSNQLLRQCRVDTPIASLVRIGQRTALDAPSKSHVIKSVRARRQAVDRISQTVPIGQLRKRHAEKLIPAGKRLNLVVAPVPRHASVELLRMYRIEELNKNRPSCIHATSVAKLRHRKKQGKVDPISNRSHFCYVATSSL